MLAGPGLLDLVIPPRLGLHSRDGARLGKYRRATGRVAKKMTPMDLRTVDQVVLAMVLGSGA